MTLIMMTMPTITRVASRSGRVAPGLLLALVAAAGAFAFGPGGLSATPVSPASPAAAAEAFFTPPPAVSVAVPLVALPAPRPAAATGDTPVVAVAPATPVARPAPAPATSQEGDEEDGEDGALLDAGTLGRWLTYLALFLMVGAVTFGPVSRRAFPPADEALARIAAAARARALRLGLVGSALFLAASAERFYAQVVSFLFPGDPLTLADARTMLLDTSWGARWSIQVGAALVAGVGFLLARRRATGSPAPAPGPEGPEPGPPPARRFPRWLAAAGTLATALALPLTGHAVANSWSWTVTWPLQSLHVLGGSAWLGSLLVLVAAGLTTTTSAQPAVRERAVAGLVAVFSPLALSGVAAAVAAGLVLAVAYVGSWADLWATSYGRLLLLKLALVGATGALGAYNWRRIKPRLGAPGSSAALAKSARVELLIGALLLAATAILVALPAPHT